MKTAISLPDKLFAAAEREAKRRGVSRSKLYQQALEKLIANARDEAVSDALTRSYVASPEPDDPFMDRILARTMARVEWNARRKRSPITRSRGSTRSSSLKKMACRCT